MNETTKILTITITPKARAELKKLGVQGENFLRIQIIPGGCSGMTYSAAIDTVVREGKDEVVYQDDELRVVAEEGNSIFLEGLVIDYSDDLVKSGFRFKNPNATSTCGCGSSFKA